jgi:hypothetical protein
MVHYHVHNSVSMVPVLSQIHSTPSNPISLRYILILSSHPLDWRLGGPQSWSAPAGNRTQLFRCETYYLVTILTELAQLYFNNKHNTFNIHYWYIKKIFKLQWDILVQSPLYRARTMFQLQCRAWFIMYQNKIDLKTFSRKHHYNLSPFARRNMGRPTQGPDTPIWHTQQQAILDSHLQDSSNMHLRNHFRSEEERNNKIAAECYVLQRWVLLKCLGCVQTDRQQAYQCAESHETAHPQLECYDASSQWCQTQLQNCMQLYKSNVLARTVHYLLFKAWW